MVGLSGCAIVDAARTTGSERDADGMVIDIRPGDNDVSGVYGIADARRTRVCRSASHRAFDFWVGEWTTTRPNGLSGGESSVSVVLNGCAIDERYNGGTGRSLSRYDRASGLWQQDYIDTTGFTLRLTGTLDSTGAMRMADSIRAIPNGPALASTFVWTPSPTGTVRQIWNFSLDGGRNFAVNSNLVYARAPQPVSPPAPTRSLCTNRPADRVLDGLLGRWKVRDRFGRRLGETSLVLGAGGCLIEESFQGPFGYRMTSFLYRDRFVGRWYRVHADNAANTFRTAGSVSGTTLQMTGLAPGLGGTPVPVRLTLDLADISHPTQRWELQRDAGTWVTYAELTWTRIE
jgi:hypothetical protein